MVSFGPKLVIGDATFMSAPTALPRSTLVTDAVAGIGAGVVAGVVAGGGVVATGAGSSFFLQPTMATAPNRATSRAEGMRLRFMRAFLVRSRNENVRATGDQSRSPSPS